MTLDIRASGFWDQAALEREERRIFDICTGCRRCFNLCPSFAHLFAGLDQEAVDGEAERLPTGDLRRVEELCYQCKLCFNHCPYTPPHRFDLDFPRVMLRARAVRARREGVTRQDRLLGDPDRLGRLGTLTAPLSTWANTFRPHRLFLERVVGIHRDRQLPPFAREPFSRWFARRRSGATGGERVALFATCSVEYHDPAVGKAAVAVLERNGLAVELPPQRCCGMPWLDGGDIDAALAKMEANLRSLAPLAEAGVDIVVPGPTCSYVLKQEYPWLHGSPEARVVAARTFDLMEYLMRRHEAGRLDMAFQAGIGRIAYQIPCHLRAQNIGFKSRDALALIPGARVGLVERCSGMDGTWGMKREFYGLSLRVAEPLLRELREARADQIATDCPLSALQIAQGLGSRPLHPVQLLARAYGIEEA
ncbi:MAG: 4Fe-4S dicluster domain-containing protein [Candidatus Rokubacteria bacterium]|nr:4Fe-4S dicluster domain-containing protein [Candidatus Rokubacteria bacterium]